jgi:hypothetical protein
MPQIVVPGSWHNVTRGRIRSDFAATTLGGLLHAFASEFPDAAYRLYTPDGALLRYHIFFVDGEQVPRAAPVDQVPLVADSVVRVIPPLAGG